MKYILIFSIVNIVLGLELSGQDTLARTYRKYATQTVLRNQKFDIGKVNKKNQSEKEINDFKVNGKFKNIRIPVVFHLLYNEQKDAKVENEIIKQLEVLNLDYGSNDKILVKTTALKAEKFDKKIAKIDLEFCIGEGKGKNKGPGIMWKPVGNKVWNTNDKMKSSETGGSDPWDTDEYLNVWVCHMGNDTAGYAQMPGGQVATDGIVIDFSYFGTTHYSKPPFHKGKTLSHLVGSYLGLYELWNENHPCADDGVADTPIHNAPNHGKAEIYRHISLCDGNPVEMSMNIMDNSDDESLFMLTEGQKYRIQSVLSDKGLRNKLLNGASKCDKKDVQNEIIENRTEISEQLQKKQLPRTIGLYPNPANTMVNLILDRYPENVLDAEVVIYNGTGAIVKTEKIYFSRDHKEYSLDISTIPDGLYFVAMRIEDHKVSETLIINR